MIYKKFLNIKYENKLWTFCLAILICFSIQSLFAQNLKVMSYNILEGGKYGIDQIFQKITENDPDIVLLQETSVLNDELSNRANAAGYNIVQNDIRGWELEPAILSKFPIVTSSLHHSSLEVLIEISNGIYLKAHSVHLPPLELNGERRYLLKQNINAYLRYDREKYPTIFGGDLNLWSNQTDILGMLTEIDFTQDANDFLDYIYSFGLQVVPNSKKIIPGSPSDHDAIYIEYYMPQTNIHETETFTVFNKYQHQYNFNSSEFIDHFPKDGLTHIDILSIPEKGTLELNGSGVSAGDRISISDVDNLKYKNNALGIDEFEWRGVYTGGTANVSSFVYVENTLSISRFDRSKCLYDTGILNNGTDLYFGNNDYFVSSSNNDLYGAEYVKFPTYISHFNNVELDQFFSMQIDTVGELYLAFDERNITEPQWILNKFTRTNDSFNSNEHSYAVYKRNIQPGEFRFGSNNFMNWEQRSNVDHFIFIVVPTADPSLNVQPVSPLNGQFDLETDVSLIWSNSPTASSYHLQVSPDINFNNVVYENSSISETTFTLTELEIGTAYYWRVKGKSNSAEGSWSEIFTFATGLGENAPAHKSADLRVNEIIYVEDDNPVHSNANPSAYQITGKNLTVEAWAKLSSYPEDGAHSTIIVRPYNGEPWQAYDLRVANFDDLEKPEIQTLVSNGTSNWGFANWTSQVPLNEWIHIALSYDGNLVKLLINGELVSSGYFSESIGQGETGLYIGGTFDWVNFSGWIDEVRLWNVTRTDEEIRAYRFVRLKGDEQGLIGYWLMDEIETVNGIRVVKDKTVNQNHLRVGNLNLSDDTPMGSSNPTAVQYEETQPVDFQLYQNYPNPFNPSTTIKFGLPVQNKVRLVIYNMLGQKVATLLNEEMDAGYHSVEWDASGTSSGIYFYKISTGEFVQTNKMILMK